MHTLHKISFIFVIIGALNWGTIAAFDFNMVTYAFGQFAPFTERIIYGLVGVAALVEAGMHYSMCCSCNPNCSCAAPSGSSKKKSKKRK